MITIMYIAHTIIPYISYTIILEFKKEVRIAIKSKETSSQLVKGRGTWQKKFFI